MADLAHVSTAELAKAVAARTLRAWKTKLALLLSTSPLWSKLYKALDAALNAQAVREILNTNPTLWNFIVSWGPLILMGAGFLMLFVQVRKAINGIRQSGDVIELKVHECPDRSLHTVADEQAQAIDQFIVVQRCVIGKNELLGRANPYIELMLTIENHSIYDVEVGEPKGHISYGERELSGALSWVEKIMPRHGKDYVITLRQPLDRDDAIELLNGELHVLFDCSRLELPLIHPALPLDSSLDLHSQFRNITNAALLEKYPKLLISISNAIIDWALDSVNYEIPKSHFFVNIYADVENKGRPVDIEIVRFKLITQIAGKAQVLFPESGNTVWTKLRDDPEHGLVVAGKQIENLNTPPLVIPNGKAVTGRVLQFMLDKLSWPEFERVVEDSFPFTLEMTDKHGERHPAEGVMRWHNPTKIQEL